MKSTGSRMALSNRLKMVRYAYRVKGGGARFAWRVLWNYGKPPQ